MAEKGGLHRNCCTGCNISTEKAGLRRNCCTDYNNVPEAAIVVLATTILQPFHRIEVIIVWGAIILGEKGGLHRNVVPAATFRRKRLRCAEIVELDTTMSRKPQLLY